MNKLPEGVAIVYCEGAFNTTNGKTAHGLVRFTRRYNVVGVIDSRYAGQDAGEVLDGISKNIPIYDGLESALKLAPVNNTAATHFIIGLAPDGGRLSIAARLDVKKAVEMGLNIDCGLHDYLSEDEEISELAERKGVTIRDIRKPLPVDKLHFFSGKIEEVRSLKIAVLGTDSAVGKRTTARILSDSLNQIGMSAEMIGTGQTSWMQGAKYCVIFDSLVNDFVSGEIEHAVWSAWRDTEPQVIIIEGQGSLMNPAYPGGFEIIAAGRPDLIILQHAPARKEYDGFPGYPIHPLGKQIQVVEMLSGKPVVAITINHEDIRREEIPAVCDITSKITGLPAFDVLTQGADGLIATLKPFLKNTR
jgi:uncharacterized NAD-dependent epimerase/dehydratase family protein